VVAIESDFTNFVTELTRKRVKESERTALIEDMLKEIEQIRGRKNKTS
jgi:hypothetical protein